MDQKVYVTKKKNKIIIKGTGEWGARPQSWCWWKNYVLPL